MDEKYKEVFFYKYCKTCEHEKTEETKYPCNVCFAKYKNLYSNKPVKWEEKRMKFYRSMPTGRIVTEYSLSVIKEVYGSTVEPRCVLEEIKPTVIDCILDGSKITAIHRYRDIHNCGIAEAKKAVETMMKDISRFRKEKKNV